MTKLFKIELPYPDLSTEERNRLGDFYLEEISNTHHEWVRSIYLFLFQWIGKNEFFELKTSGSTGAPKNITIKKDTMLFSARQTADYFHFKTGEKWLHCIPAEFAGGQMILVRAILSNAEVWAVEPKIKLNGLSGEFDFASMIPMQVENYITQSDFLAKRILIGGAAIPISLEEKLKRETKTEYFASYGMTETVSHIALRKVNGKDASGYFIPLKNILVGKDERGCLTVYNRNYSEKVLVTNDLVEFNADHQFKILGRTDNIINSGGLKIIPEEIENIVSKILSCRSMIIGVDDETKGEKLVLLIEGKELDSSTLTVLKSYLSEHLEKNKIPREIKFVEKFSETASGKPHRLQTKAGYLKNLRTNL